VFKRQKCNNIQAGRLEAIQCRAINIIFCYSLSTPYILHWRWLAFPLYYSKRYGSFQALLEKHLPLPAEHLLIRTTFSRRLGIQP